MSESNQMTPINSMIQESLARRAMILEQHCNLGLFLACMNDILAELDKIAIGTVGSKKSNEWLKNHPIMILLAYKLKGMILTNPDISYIQAKLAVKDMAHV